MARIVLMLMGLFDSLGIKLGGTRKSFAKTIDKESEGSFALLAKAFAVPTQTTTYENFCFLESDLVAMSMPADTSLHGIGIEPIVDAQTDAFVHHFIVYGSEIPTSCGGLEGAYGWAPGDLPIALPSKLGSLLGTDGYHSYRIQIHYNNPSVTSGLLNSSGIKVFWTSQKREFDMGVLQLGDSVLHLSGEPIGNGLTSHEFQCGTSCSGTFLPQPITVIREQLHMHISGHRMFNQQIRDSEALRVVTVDFFDY
jgi:hypothetical protein